MTKLIQNVAEYLSPAEPQPTPAEVGLAQPRIPHLTRDEMEALFARELGRVRFH